MTWKYNRATFHGSKTNPQPGNYVTVYIQDDADPEPALHELSHTFTFDGTKTKLHFAAIVKQEIKAHIAALNAALQEADATSEFDPT